MMQFIYGVFDDRRPADRALAQLQHVATIDEEFEREVSTAAIHESDFDNINIPRAGHGSKRLALLGALLVGGSVGLFLTLLMNGVFARIGGPPTIFGSGPIDVVFVTLATAAFGAVGAAIAGSAGNRARVRSLRHEIEQGRVVLTLEAAGRRTRDVIRTLERFGAVEAGSL
jgi:hypothetical protein